ncbi:hypothetical protein [Apilactobacillus xinyiensis]|uniref:hypothetical protein n=1 Tax=Apilactobacillus xinyiensis TaxID=2841032 RepID=UPI00200E74BC|nr:hypothetical protein [Apilactobacillus xinyiensis]MCL0330788.1 hypothetical protein [Apilactobacillus xinyiensis]
MKKSLSISMLLFLLSLFLFLNINNKQANAGAWSNHYLKKFPKSIRGTWYTYTNFGYGKKKIYKLKANAKKLHFHPYVKHNIGAGALPKATKKEKRYFNKTIYWTYCDVFKFQGRKWFNFMGWQQDAGDGDNYNISKLKGHRVLTLAGGAGNWVSAHYYKSRQLAKKMGEKHYQGFIYMKD